MPASPFRSFSNAIAKETVPVLQNPAPMTWSSLERSVGMEVCWPIVPQVSSNKYVQKKVKGGVQRRCGNERKKERSADIPTPCRVASK